MPATSNADRLNALDEDIRFYKGRMDKLLEELEAARRNLQDDLCKSLREQTSEVCVVYGRLVDQKKEILHRTNSVSTSRNAFGVTSQENPPRERLHQELQQPTVSVRRRGRGRARGRGRGRGRGGYVPPFRQTELSFAKLRPEDRPPIVWVRNLPVTTSEEKLRKSFESFGEVSRIRIYRDTHCAQIIFVRADSAVAAMDRGVVIGTVRLTLSVTAPGRVENSVARKAKETETPSETETARSACSVLVIRNVDEHLRAEDLKDYLNRRGEFLSLTFPTKSIAKVECASRTDAEKIVRNFNCSQSGMKISFADSTSNCSLREVLGTQLA